MAFEILAEKSPVEDTEDDESELQDILRNFDGYVSHFISCHFGSSPFFAKLLTDELSFTIIRLFKQQKPSSTIISN